MDIIKEFKFMLNTIVESLSRTYSGKEGNAAWAVAFVSFLVSCMGNAAIPVYCLFILAAIDAVFAISASIKIGGGIESRKLRKLCIKMAGYAICVGVFIVFDMMFKDSDADNMFFTKAICWIFGGCELWSIIGNLIIVFPQLSALRIARTLFTKEVSNKIGVDQSMVEKAMSDANNEAKDDINDNNVDKQ